MQASPWQIIPDFSPGETNVEIYTRTVRFSLRPNYDRTRGKGNVVTQVILRIKGTAMEIVMANESDFASRVEQALKNLISLLGGDWGATP